MNKETSEIKSAKHSPWKDVGMSDPRARLKSLSDYASMVELDRNIPPQRYYRSGVEMIRMADMCMKDNDLEYAYILYVKFITIFVEKIRNHPQFNTVPLKDKEHNQQTLRKVLPKAEELKKQLLEQYQTEYNKYLEDVKEREKIEKERLKQEELKKLREEEERKNKLAALAAVKAAKAAMTTSVTSPEDGKVKKFSSISSRPLVSPSSDIIAQTSREKTGFFILTPEYGLDFIANCRETGFHPHPTDPPLYTKAKHCKLDVTAVIEVVDLRRK
ncbi:hypothetical protein E2986_00569 [Frieseomelitta varia]|uniref:USP8 dimerisation domain-containing protein n=1 Tax=Frieseomelitta varia TaxID=561572 RepID=A0A833RZK2_9HYME|nr:hypothetical protein E2986_00569 [Frieseomelitta varia]